jgi:hypothetical protein
MSVSSPNKEPAILDATYKDAVSGIRNSCQLLIIRRRFLLWASCKIILTKNQGYMWLNTAHRSICRQVDCAILLFLI